MSRKKLAGIHLYNFAGSKQLSGIARKSGSEYESLYTIIAARYDWLRYSTFIAGLLQHISAKHNIAPTHIARLLFDFNKDGYRQAFFS
jgi:hypothetical protein